MVFTRRVSSRMEITVAGCQADGFGTLVTVVSLFAPRVAVAVVSVHLPEPWFVVLHEPQAPDPFRRLPEVQVRHEETGRTTMLGREWLALELPDNQPLPIQQILDRKVGCIPAVAESHHERRRRVLEPGRSEDALNGDAAPFGVELRPARHAVNVYCDIGWPKRTKLIPAPRGDARPVLRLESECPSVQRGVWSCAGGQYGKVAGDVLPWREPFRPSLGSSTLKASGDHFISPSRWAATSRIGLIAIPLR